YPSSVIPPTGISTRPLCASSAFPSEMEDIKTCHIGITEQNATSPHNMMTIASTTRSPAEGVSTILILESVLICLCFIILMPPQNSELSVNFLLSALEPISRTVPTTLWNRPEAADRE